MKVGILIGLITTILYITAGVMTSRNNDRSSQPEVCIQVCVDDPSTPEIECLSPCEN